MEITCGFLYSFTISAGGEYDTHGPESNIAVLYMNCESLYFSAGLISGIALAILLFVLTLIIIIYLVMKRRKTRNIKNRAISQTESSQDFRLTTLQREDAEEKKITSLTDLCVANKDHIEEIRGRKSSDPAVASMKEKRPARESMLHCEPLLEERYGQNTQKSSQSQSRDSESINTVGIPSNRI